jgi:hypothetical protein
MSPGDDGPESATAAAARRAEERDRPSVRGVERQGCRFVSYGVHGGTRAVEHLRRVLAELKVAGVRSQVVLSL